MSAAEKLKSLDLEPFAFVENESGREAVAIDLAKWRGFQFALPQIVAVVAWMEEYAEADDWHAYVGTGGGRIDDEVDALLAALDEALG